jgi:hypothetical protein
MFAPQPTNSTLLLTMKWIVTVALVAMPSVAFTAVGTATRPKIHHQLFASTLQQQQTETKAHHHRPLLQQFGRGINQRVLNSKEGSNRFGLAGHYTSAETIPCLDMQCSGGDGRGPEHANLSSPRAIRKAYTAACDSRNSSSNKVRGGQQGLHGRSSGSGCSIIRLRGKDAVSVRGLVDFADDFFEGVDDDDFNAAIKDVGVFRIANNVHAGFDGNVNLEGKMQVLYTKLIAGTADEETPVLLPLEVGELVGPHSLSHAHEGMSALLDIGSQITSAVLGMDASSTNKLLDDCTTRGSGSQQQLCDPLADNVSNSYQRLIRYLEPRQGNAAGEADPAFWPHVDSTFLTLIPMSALPGLEVWCPSSLHAKSSDLAQRGEWVRPIRPITIDNDNEFTDDEDDCVYVFALAGEFLQLLSDGDVPTCIHRVIPPTPSSPDPFGMTLQQKYKPRVSAPMFVRPRRGEEAILNVRSDLNKSIESITSRGLYFQEGLLEECDDMLIWDYMDCMSPNN